MNGTNVPRDWDRVVGYYYKHYQSTIERLFNENGYEIVKPELTPHADTISAH